MNKKILKEAELPVFEVLKAIKEGSLDPGLISKETRESCVEALVVDASERYWRRRPGSQLIAPGRLWCALLSK